MLVYYDGEFMPSEQVSIHFEDRGYQFADGIYEVVRIYNNRLFRLQPHLERLQLSAAGIELDLPWSAAELTEAMLRLVEENKPGDGIIYLQITRGVSPRNHKFPGDPKPVMIMYTREFKRPLENMQNGVAAITAPDERWLRCNIKSISLLPNVLAKQRASRADAYEAILVRNGKVTEGSSSNVLCVRGNMVYTHPANNLVLNGITRQALARIVRQEGLHFVEEAFDVPFLLGSDEAIDSSTTSEVTPIIRIDGHPIGTGTPGPVTRRLQAAFDREIERETGKA
ncbi:MAG: D-amino-acid transaminase [Symbiobacteriia bacterium]